MNDSSYRVFLTIALIACSDQVIEGQKQNLGGWVEVHDNHLAIDGSGLSDAMYKCQTLD